MKWVKITNHAVDRYRERVRAIPGDRQAARAEMMFCVDAARAKYDKNVSPYKMTSMVPTGCCIFVFEGRSMVTVLPRTPAEQSNYDKDDSRAESSMILAERSPGEEERTTMKSLKFYE